MAEIEPKMTKSNILPKDLESFTPDMESMRLLDTFFTRYGRIAYVSLYKQSIMKMTDKERKALYHHEDEEETKIAMVLGGIGPQMFDRDLFNQQIDAKDILNKEDVYSSLEEIKTQATENPSLFTYMNKLTKIFESLINEEDFRHLRYITNKYRGYVSQIYNLPEYKAETQRRVQAILDDMDRDLDSNLFTTASN
jgi:hypothetical protein